MHGSWMVFLKDGRTIAQYDADHPEAFNGEVPMRVIPWPMVERLQLASQYAVTEFEIPEQPDAEYRLVQRTMLTFQDSTTIFMLVMLVPGYAYPFEQKDVLRVMYWIPDGSTHDCTEYQCNEVRAYCEQFMWGRESSALAQTHNKVQTTIDAVIE